MSSAGPITSARRRALLFTALSALALGCSGDEPGRRGELAQLRLEVDFEIMTTSPRAAGARPAAQPGDQAAIEQVVATIFDDSVSPARVVDQEQDDIAPGETRFELSLQAPPGERYLVRVETIGVRGNGGEATERGLLHSGESAVLDLTSGEARTVPVTLRDVVPRLSLVSLPPDRYRLDWNPIAGAARYRLAEIGPNSTIERTTAATETTIIAPPSLAPPIGRVRYRVRAELDDGRVGAYSESVGVGVVGPTPPSAITDLRVALVADTLVALLWTAPGDDGAIGRAAAYDLRYSFDPIDGSNFEAAIPVAGLSPPATPGESDGRVVTGLLPRTLYFFALVTLDELGLGSELSNVVSATTLTDDRSRPAAVDDLTAEAVSETSARLRWTAPGDDGEVGQADEYEVRVATFPIDAGNFATATPVDGVPAPAPAGGAESIVVFGLTRETRHYFALVTRDEVRNESLLSNVAEVTTADLTPPARVTDLFVRRRELRGFQVSYTAPGDDGIIGQAASYDLRYSSAPILDEESWSEAIPVEVPPPPLEGGHSVVASIEGFSPRTVYYLAFRARDEAGNQAALSNLVQTRTLVEPPDPLIAVLAFARTFTLDWAFASPDPDGFVLDRRVGSGPWRQHRMLEGDSRRTLDGNLLPATLYTYRVRAFVGADTSDYSIEASGVTEDDPPLCQLSSYEPDFGFVLLGESDTLSVLLTNVGGGLLEGVVEEECGEFSLALADPSFSLARDESVVIPVVYTPTDETPDFCSISTGTNCSILVEGNGLGPRCAVDRVSIDLGDIGIGHVASELLTIRNEGGAVLTGLAGAGRNCGDDLDLTGSPVGSGLGFSLGAGQSKSILVSLSPDSAGAYVDCVVDLGTECDPVPVTARGVYATVAPGEIDFGDVQVQFARQETFRLANVTTTSRLFTIYYGSSQQCPAFTPSVFEIFLAPEQAVDITVTFEPFFSGVHDCLLRIDPGGIDLPLTGRGFITLE